MTVNKIDDWTPDYLTGLTAEQVDEAVRKVGAAFRSLDRSKARTLIAAAYAMNAALKVGMKQTEVGKRWGKDGESLASSTLILVRRLGVCSVDLGITPEDNPNEWALLAGKAGANIAHVAQFIEPKSPGKDKDGKALPAPAPSRDAVIEALTVAFDPSGKKRTTAEIKAILDPEGAATDQTPAGGDGSEGGNVAPTRSIEARVRDAVTLLQEYLPQVGDEQWAEVRDSMYALTATFESEVERRAPKGKAKKSA